MQIEFIGCTSAGKSTLARRMLRVGREMGLDTQLSDDFVLKLISLNRIKNEFMRRRVIELLSLFACLIFWPKYHKFYRTAIRICRRAPGSWFYRFNVARIALRKIGIYEIIRRCSSEQQVVLVDNEGVLQASHALFVHDTVWSSVNDLSALLQSAPLPDVAIYVSQPVSVLIERAFRRGHNRISDRSLAKVEIFIKQAVAMFDELQRHPMLADRLLVIDGKMNAVAAWEHHQDPVLDRAYKLVDACINANAADNVVKSAKQTRSCTRHPGQSQQQTRDWQFGWQNR